jgi:pilus assembly protein CpaE
MIRILIANTNPATREVWRSHLASDANIEVVGMARDGQEALQIAHQNHPDIALLAADLAVADGYQTAAYIRAAKDLPTECILIGDIEAPGDLRRAMRAGASEAMFGPINRTKLLEVIQDLYANQELRKSSAFAKAADPANRSCVFVVTAAKGGVGKTTIAVNLALSVMKESGEPTVLFDLYSQFGDVGVMINIAPQRTLSEFADLEPNQIDEQLIEDSMERHASGLRVLFASKSLASLDLISVPLVENTVGILKRNYRYIIIDCPPYLYPVTLHTIAHATKALVVVNLYDLTTFSDTHQWFQTVASKYLARERIEIVVNRVLKSNRLLITDIERIMGHPVSFQIPNDDRIVSDAANSGSPFVLTHPSSPVAQGIRRIARELVNDAADGPKPDSLLDKGDIGGQQATSISRFRLK